MVRTGSVVNVADAYNDTRFDPIMDMRTGYKTKQMLCAPVFSDTGTVSAVLQLINTNDNRTFTESDETLLSYLAEEITKLVRADQHQRTNSPLTFVTEIKDPVRFKICSVIFPQSHNHLKCAVQVFHGDVQFGKTKTTPLFQSTPFSNPVASVEKIVSDSTENMISVRYCAFDFWVDFGDLDLKYSDLPFSARIILNFVSKNNHQVGWTAFTLFDFDQMLKTGRFVLKLVAGECGSPIGSVPPEVNKEKVIDPKNVVSDSAVVIELQGFENNVFYRCCESRRGDIPIHFDESVPILDEVNDEESLETFKMQLEPRVREHFEKLLSDPITKMHSDDKQILWNLRKALRFHPSVLPKFLLAVDWFDPEAVAEAYKLLYTWEIPSHIEALQLLDGRHPDPKVRSYAVRILGGLTDEELSDFMLQLTQLLMFEPHHDNSLSRFLLRRAIASPSTVGQRLFWMLRADFNISKGAGSERSEIILNVLMSKLGRGRISIGYQIVFTQQLENVAAKVSQLPSREEKIQLMREMLADIELPATFQLPISSQESFKGILLSKCDVLETDHHGSVVLQLAFQYADSAKRRIPYFVKFTHGRDIKQNQLSLQLIAVMGRIWTQAGLDLSMTHYACMSTSTTAGIIEHVENSSSLTTIEKFFSVCELSDKENDEILERWLLLRNLDHLGSRKVDRLMLDRDGNMRPIRRNALSGPSSLTLQKRSGEISTDFAEEDCLVYKNLEECRVVEKRAGNAYLVELSKGDIVEASGTELSFLEDSRAQTRYAPAYGGIDIARERFMRSCAAYTVALYVLGISDRPKTDMMLKDSGELFHVNFETFGIPKSVFGVGRGPSSVIFPPSFVHILGGVGSPLFNQFLDLSVQAFLILRQNSNLMISMFSLMVGAGFSELIEIEDIGYLRENLMLRMTEEAAVEKFRDLIQSKVVEKGIFF